MSARVAEPDLSEPTRDWVQAVRGGDRRGLARLLSAIERGTAEARIALSALRPSTGKAQRIGITGPAGCGKSTLVTQLARELRKKARSVGIIAVDPTSPTSGGALLGDRLRMQDLHHDPQVFIRSVATRGSLGGLARATAEMADALDAFGMDLVVIETVGVGQDEVEIAQAADTVVVVQAPEVGDSVGTLKAGLLEVSDVFVVNKSDQPGAARAAAALRAMLSFGPKRGWQTPVLQVVATSGQGIVELMAALDRHRAHLEASGEGRLRRASNLRRQVLSIALERLRSGLENLTAEAAWAGRLQALADGRDDPYALADRVLKEFASELPHV